MSTTKGVTRRLAAILAADVAGYSRLMAADEAGTLARFNALRSELIDPKIAQFKGRVVGTAGDSLLVEFASAVDAVQCAVEVQERLAARNAEFPEDLRMAFRMGVNLGDVIAEGDTIHGDGVNVASRLERLAEPGSVIVGRGIHDQVKGKLPYAYADLGEHPVKNIAEPVRAFLVTLAERGTPAPVKADELPLPSKPSVAVLPFNNMSGDPEQEYFSDGITEDIITELSRNRGLFVIARNSSFMFKGPAVDIADVGRKLGVRYVVEGSVRKAGKRIRVTAQLVEATTGSHIWAERYDRDLEDIFAVQDEVTERIVWALGGNLTKAEIGRSKNQQTVSLGAYDLILRGIHHFYRYTREDNARAVNLFGHAADADTSNGLALGWQAVAHAHAVFFEYDPSANDRALATARRALQLGDENDGADAAIALVCGWSGEFVTAEAHINRALSRNPNSPGNLSVKAWVTYWQGRAAEALEMSRRLERLDPMNPTWILELIASSLYVTEDFQGAVEAYQRIMPFSYAGLYGYYAACLGQIGRNEDARKAWSECKALVPDFSVENWLTTSSYHLPHIREMWLDGLRKAGIEV